jgi:diguanylate cyclase (GGDEF)-like protein
MQNDPMFETVNWEGAIIGLPLLIGSEVRGVMNVAYSRAHNFSQDEIRLLELLADQAAIAINNARLFDSEAQRRKEEERARRTTAALLDVSETIGSTMDLQEVLNAIVLAAREHLQVDRVAIFLRDPSDGSFVPSLPRKESSLTLHLNEDQISRFSSLRLNPNQYPLLQQLEQTRSTVYFKDLPSNDILPRDLIESFNIRSLMVSPIIIQNQLSGLLYVDCTNDNRTFSQEEITLATGLARQGALALERAGLYESAHSRAQELDALHSATTALLATINLESLLNQIIAAAIQAIPDAEKGFLLLKNPSNGELQVRAKFGYSDQDLIGSLPIDQVHITKATSDRTPVILPEPMDNNDIMNSMGTSELLKIKSAILTPLHYDDRAFGVLSLEAKKARIFKKSDLHVLVSFAATASAALRNAQLHAEVQKLALTDSLTGVYNRRGLFELGPREVERARRFKRSLTIILFDLDHFKEVNDRYGHAIGDQVLRELVQRCKRHIREVDILARYGGEEFVLLLPETNMKSAFQIAERLRRKVEKAPFSTDFGPIPITISLGVAGLTQRIDDFITLIERADDAMYNAKKSGRNRVSVLDDHT